MRDYAIDKGWHVPDEVSKDKGGFYVTIFSPPKVDYRALLKKYIIEGDNQDRYTEDEWDVLEDIALEINEEADEAEGS